MSESLLRDNTPYGHMVSGAGSLTLAYHPFDAPEIKYGLDTADIHSFASFSLCLPIKSLEVQDSLFVIIQESGQEPFCLTEGAQDFQGLVGFFVFQDIGGKVLGVGQYLLFPQKIDYMDYIRSCHPQMVAYIIYPRLRSIIACLLPAATGDEFPDDTYGLYLFLLRKT